MQYRTTTLLGVSLLALGLAGCSSQSTHSAVHRPGPDRIYMGALGPANGTTAAQFGMPRLGAGDALGEAIFARYVASITPVDDGTRLVDVNENPDLTD